MQSTATANRQRIRVRILNTTEREGRWPKPLLSKQRHRSDGAGKSSCVARWLTIRHPNHGQHIRPKYANLGSMYGFMAWLNSRAN